MRIKGLSIMASICCVVTLTVLSFAATNPDSNNIVLPKPQLDKGKPLMQVLNERKSSREFDTRKLSDQDLSNILWAGFGINRPETGGRTAPSAMNIQDIDLYVSMERGCYRYDAKSNSLVLVLNKDIREFTGKQPFVKDAPVNIVFVADNTRNKKNAQGEINSYATADAAFISENIYLYCASEGLSTVVRASVDKQAFAKALQLKPTQEIVLAQTIGYPKKNAGK